MIGSKQPFASKVLVVDDDPTIRLLAGEALGQAGFQVKAINDGSQVASILAEYIPDIILLDVLMPQMDGYRACSLLRKSEQGADIPVLMMTGLDDLHSIQEAYQAGATDFITKPIHWQVLPFRVQYIIRTSYTYKELKTAKILLSRTQRLAGIGSWTWDMTNDTIRWSDELYHIFNLHPQDVDQTPHSFFRFVHPLDQEMVKAAIETTIAEKLPLSIDHRIILPTGVIRYVHSEATIEFSSSDIPAKMLGIVQDITERKRSEEQITYLAYYDSLTGLPNRVLFLDRFEQALRRAERRKEVLAVLFIDLDDFKLINDTHGHRMGDLLLEGVSLRLALETREDDTLARLAGDEFIVLLQDIKSRENALHVADKQLQQMMEPFQLEDKQLFIFASIGIALYPEHGKTAEVLIKSADTAMYKAKEKGKNHVEFFTEAFHSRLLERLSLSGDLRRGLEREEFTLHYQPRIDLQTGCWSGVEALVRWQHPERGLLSPRTFIPLAEESGLIIQLGEWVLREACRQLHRWHSDGIKIPRVSINISSLQLRRHNIVQLVKSAIRATCLCPQTLELEVTERALMDGLEQSITILKKLKQLGVYISIDDFGTGYSSLSTLRRLPIDCLKIDRIFIKHSNECVEDARILAAIITLAHSLKMSVVAKGVECKEHEALLLAYQCREAQGFYYARPMPAEEYLQWK